MAVKFTNPPAAATKAELPPFGQAPGAQDEMFTREELAAKLKVTLRSIENWQRDGFLPYIKIGNAVWFYWPDVVQHLLAHYRTLRGEPVAAPHALPTKGGSQ